MKTGLKIKHAYLCVFFWGGGQVVSAAGKLPLSLSNDHLSIEYKKENGAVELQSIRNKATGDVSAISGDTFAFQIAGEKGASWLNSSECKIDSGKIIKFNGKQTLSYTFSSAKKPGLSVTLNYTLGDKDFFARRSLRLNSTKPILVKQLDAWKVSVKDKCIYQKTEVPEFLEKFPACKGSKRWGVPVYLTKTFWGLEYPAGHNRFENGQVLHSHFPGRKAKWITAKSAVFGVRRYSKSTKSNLLRVKNPRELFRSLQEITSREKLTS